MKDEIRDHTLLLTCELFLYFGSSIVNLRWIGPWLIGPLAGPEPYAFAHQYMHVSKNIVISVFSLLSYVFPT